MRQLPEQLESPRLLLRLPTPADAEELNRAIVSSHEELRHWLPWAATPQTLEQTREFCESAARRREAGEALAIVLQLRATGQLVGGSGYPRLDWSVPKFEIGYWVRSDVAGQGLASEATLVLARYAFTELEAARVELRMDHANVPSYRVAERLGFKLEGVLQADSRNAEGQLRDTRVYAVTDPINLIDQPR